MPRKAKKNGSKEAPAKPAPATTAAPPVPERHILTPTEQAEMKPLEDELLTLKLKMANLRLDFLAQERQLEAAVATANQLYLDRTALMIRNHGLDGVWSMNQTTYELTPAR